MSWTIGTVTLPFEPQRVHVHGESIITEHDVYGEQPVLFASYFSPLTLTLEGQVYGPGSTSTNLENTWILPLNTLRGTTCPVTSPASRYNGTWLCSNFEFSEVAEGGDAKFDYIITLELGTESVVF